MKPIKFIVKNRKKIEGTLKKINGETESFCITSYCQINSSLDKAEKMLSFLEKKDRIGIKIYLSPEGPSGMPNNHPAKSTHIFLEIKEDGLFLTDVNSFKVWPGSKESILIHANEFQYNTITTITKKTTYNGVFIHT